jgi:small subunit ribosomal protein S10e
MSDEKKSASPSTLVPKANRDNVYRFLFTEGVLSCEKNPLGVWHGQLGGAKFDVPALQVMQLMRSMKSRNLIREQVAWRHFYWFLTDEGVAFLRKALYLPEAAVPNTQKKVQNEADYEVRRERPEGERRGGRGFGRGRGAEGERRGGRGFGRGRGGFGADRAEYNAEGGAPRGRGFGRGRGRGAAEGATEAAPAQE